MPDGEAEAAPASRSAAAEARRRRILDKGQERLKHITFGGSGNSGEASSSSGGGSSVSRSLHFGDDAVDGSGDFNSGSLTPAASGVGVEAQGAALRSKSWLALQDSPAKSPGKTPRKSSDLPGNFQVAASPAAASPAAASPSTPAAAAMPSAIQRAASAKLLPISSPAPGYESDDEALVSPIATGSPQASSATHVTRSAWSPASLSTSPLPNGGSADMSPARSVKWAGYRSLARTAPAARRSKAASSCSALFSTALARTAALRTALAALLAVFFAGGLQHAFASWTRHIGPLHTRPQLLRGVPPIAVLLLLEVAVIAAAHLLLYLWPAVAAKSQPAESGSTGWASLVLSSAAPRLHSAFSILAPLHRQLWQDISVYVFTVAALTTFGGVAYQSCWPWLHSFTLPGVTLSSWQLAASRWTL